MQDIEQLTDRVLRTLASREPRLHHGGADAALYGLALAEWLGLRQ